MTHCKYCGNAVDSDENKCPSCGARIDYQEEDTVENAVDLEDTADLMDHDDEDIRFQMDLHNIKNYLVWSILCTIFFFFPFGIPAIVYGIMVNKRLKSGDVAGAKNASKKAKIWTWAAFIAGMVMYYLIGKN